MSVIKIKRGTTDPTAANVTNAGELAANTSTPKVFLKTADDSSTTPIWVGAQIEASPGDWTSAVKLPTQSAVNTTFMPKAGGTFTGVTSFGQGATAAGEIRLLEDTDDGANYTAFRGSARAANITYVLPTTDPTAGQVLSSTAPTTNVATLSWVDTSSATTVTVSNDNTNISRYLVFVSGSGSGSTLYVDETTGPLYYNPSTSKLTMSGDLDVNGGDIFTTQTTATVFNATATTLSMGSAATTVSIGADTGTFAIRNPAVLIGSNVGGTNGTIFVNDAKLILTTANYSGVGVSGNTYPKISLDVAYGASAYVNVEGADLRLGRKILDGTTNVAVNLVFEGATDDGFETTLTATDPTADRTITLPNASDTLVGKATTDTFTNKTFDTAGTGNSFSINATAITAVTGSGSAVLATSPTLVTPVLGTPSSGNLSNCTALPITGLTGSTSTALGVGTIELGHATDTTIARVSAGVVSIEGVNVVTTSSTDTLTNKTLTTPKIAQISDTAGLAVLKTAATASAVNEVTITNAATLTAPHITATGTDANISLHLAPKGTGKYVVIENGTDGTKQIAIGVASATTNTTTYLNAAQTADRTITLPDVTGTVITSGNLSSITATGTIASGTWNGTSIAVANGGTGTSTGSITGTGALTFTAGGTNTNVNLAPNGSGTVDVASKKITSVATPTASTDAANKQYVDDIAQGLHMHSTVAAATTAKLATLAGVAVSYSAGSITWTAGTALTSTFTDGQALTANTTEASASRLLVKNEGDVGGLGSAYNGVWYAYGARELRRAIDGDVAADWAGGDFVFVLTGTLYNNTGWVNTEKVTTLYTDPILFEQFSGAGTYTADESTLTRTGSQFSIKSTYVGQSSITTLGTIGTGIWNGTVVGLTYGGTGKALTAVNGGIVWSDADSLEITAAGTSGYVLTSGGAATPTWTNATDANTASTIVKRDASGNFTAGTMTGTASNASAVTMASDTSDTTCFLSFVNAATASSQALKYNSSLTYDATTNYIGANIDGGTY